MFYTLHLGACYSKWMAGMFQTWKSLKQGWKWKCRRMIRDQPWWLRSWSWKMKVGMYHGRCKMIKDKRSQRKRCRKKCNKPSWCWKKGWYQWVLIITRVPNNRRTLQAVSGVLDGELNASVEEPWLSRFVPRRNLVWLMFTGHYPASLSLTWMEVFCLFHYSDVPFK